VADFVKLTCPSCGGTLKITNDIDRFACAYCGTEHVVQRGEGIVSLAPVVESLKRVEAGVRRVEAGVDKTASELAIPRLREEIPQLEDRRQAVIKSKPALPSSPWAWVSMIVGVLFVLPGLIRPELFEIFFLGVLFVLGGLALLYNNRSHRQRVAERIESIDADAHILELEIEHKRDELARHEKTVSSR
jgi:hypothetical protein